MPKKPKTKPKAKTKRNRHVKIVSTTRSGPSLERARVVGKDLDDRESIGGAGRISNAELDGLEAGKTIEAGMTALARGTDALVTRVVNSAREHSRDPGEHILDLSKAYYQEESSEGQHSVQCDRCLLKSPGASSRRAAEKIAEATGWVVRDDYDHCPVCKDGSLLLKSGGVALAVPPKLSPSDLILVVRLRYIGDKIERGASVDAFLQNAARSGHRSMLSDLAQESNYDALHLCSRIDALLKKNAEVPAVFASDPKGAAFLVKLYDELKAQDIPL